MGPRLFDPDHGIRRQPVMSMHHVKAADMIFGLEEVPDEGAAHFLDFVDEVGVQVVRAVVMPDPVDPGGTAGAEAGSGEDVHFMAAALERRRELRHVCSDSSHCVRMQCLPGEHRDLHAESAACVLSSTTCHPVGSLALQATGS